MPAPTEALASHVGRDWGVRGVPPRSARTGILLCGGASRRMGRDKALLRLGGRTLLERAAEVLDAVAGRVVLAPGRKARYPQLGLPQALDPPGAEGPLAGLSAGLTDARRAGSPWALVLPCDAVGASRELLEALLRRAVDTGADAALLETPRGLEPLLAAYAPERCLPPIQAALAAGRRRATDFHRGFGEVRVARLDLAELPPAVRALRPERNVNSPEEFLREGGQLE